MRGLRPTPSPRSPQEPFVGRTERELAWRIEELFHEHGGDGLAFDTLVAAGPNGPSPHAEPGDTPIPAGTLVIVDAGCTIDGYCSDCTRTFATGELPDEPARDLRRLPRGAARARSTAIRPGMTAARPTRRLARVIEAAGFGENFGHGLGHGVGLAVHEAPRARPESEDVLEPGNVVTSSRASTCRRVRRPDRGPRRRHGRRRRAPDDGAEGARDRRVDCPPLMAEIVNTNQFKNGMHIELEGSVWRIVEFQHVKPGKGGAFVRTKLKSSTRAPSSTRPSAPARSSRACTPR